MQHYYRLKTPEEEAHAVAMRAKMRRRFPHPPTHAGLTEDTKDNPDDLALDLEREEGWYKDPFTGEMVQ